MFLLARLRGANLRGVPDWAFDPKFFQQVQKPLHRSNRFDAYQHRLRKAELVMTSTGEARASTRMNGKRRIDAIIDRAGNLDCGTWDFFSRLCGYS